MLPAETIYLTCKIPPTASSEEPEQQLPPQFLTPTGLILELKKRLAEEARLKNKVTILQNGYDICEDNATTERTSLPS